MNNKTLISKRYVDKKELIDKAKEIAESLNFQILTENLYTELDDLNFYIDIDEEATYLITFWSMEENEFKRDEIVINGQKYFIVIDLDHDSEALPYLNKFLREFLKIYPEMLVGDESLDDFYSIREIENKDNLPNWLLV
ncbi:hypothetical protein [Tenacibaculum jejuense]|uniref:Uncharacterized protein n=1 Tax=Tenacibaculum jejuense TaxID=584609 RepID=A0A238UEX6_9FLAO|nr:hypothetical protein [Tenacibaculum jejuense]SNR17729.1 protein of unknown function [Tenacibaculum jejuense]